MKERVQRFGRALSGMVMPNIGAFIAWGIITALFIPDGRIPNATLAKMVDPMVSYLLPLLIAYTAGKVVADQRGGIIAAIATMGVIVGSDIPMFIGAMAMGPLAAWVLKKFDQAVEGKIKAGFEMLVNNFSLGIIGAILAILGTLGIAPLVTLLNGVMEAGVGFFVDRGLLPLASIFIEPAKVLFLNNAINHGILSPIGIQQAKELGHSVFFLLEANPGPGLGILLAYCLVGKGSAKSTAPGAVVIHFLGGIHEIYFPYILMNPSLLLAAMGGGAAGIFIFNLFDVGLKSPASPGSIIAIMLLSESGSYLGIAVGVLVATVVSFIIAMPLLKFTASHGDIDAAIAKKDSMKKQAKGIAEEASNKPLGKVEKIAFACDAGMGSSAMGETVLKKKLKAAGLGDIQVIHTPVSSIPADVQVVVTHQELGERAATSNPDARLVLITNFLAAPEYDILVEELAAKNAASETKVKEEPLNTQKSDESKGATLSQKIEEQGTIGKAPDQEEAKEDVIDPDAPALLYRKNIRLECKPDAKEAVIRQVGQMLVDSGYVKQSYVDAMLKREESVSTYMGDGLALPHGIEEAKKEIMHSGIAVMIFPEGTAWGEEKAHVVVGIAGVGDEHLDILALIADQMLESGTIEKLTSSTVEEVYYMLGGQ